MHDLLSDILNTVSLRGSLYFRTSFTPPWGVTVPAYENVARFHYADRGDCLVHVDGTKDPVFVAQGDLVIIPHGRAHDLYCGKYPTRSVLPLDDVLEKSGYDGQGILVYGNSDDERETQLVCGHFAFSAHTKHVILDKLPPLVHIKNYGRTAGAWMDASLKIIAQEMNEREFGSNLIAQKMSEVIFAQALRNYLKSDEAVEAGLAAFANTHLTKALKAFHAAPADRWTVDQMASIAGMSRTNFAVLFKNKLALTPMEYVTDWRVELAKTMLMADDASTGQIASNVGYASESAFVRAFKQKTGCTPAKFKISP